MSLIKWFKHDSNAHTDAKLKKVRHKYGITGYGLYWYCVELIAGSVEKTNITFHLEEDAEIIALEWSLDRLKVEEIMGYFVEINLFEHTGDKITCLKLAKRLDDTNSKNPQIRQIIDNLSLSNSDKLRVTPSNSDKLRKSPPRLDKNRLDKDTAENSPLAVTPELADVLLFAKEKNSRVDCQEFWYHYEANGWTNKDGNPIESWRKAFNAWTQRRKSKLKEKIEIISERNQESYLESEKNRQKDNG